MTTRTFRLLGIAAIGGSAMTGCGTTTMDAWSGQSQSIGHQTSGYRYANEDETTLWNAIQPPSHIVLNDSSMDVISPIQPSVISVRINAPSPGSKEWNNDNSNNDVEARHGTGNRNPDGQTRPLEVFLSSASDYKFESARFERCPEGSIHLEIQDFGADRSAVYHAVLVDVQQYISEQVAQGAMTQQQALQSLSTVIESLADIARASPLP